VAQVLGDQGIIIRTVPHPQSLRLATGYYNAEDELERLVAALVPLCK
jgi:selenocysteine lyase/cysteine desulfurase